MGLFASKVTHRQSARILHCTRRTVARRLELLGPHCRRFHRRMLARARKRGGIGGSFQLDELETFEHSRRLAPVTLPVLIGRRSYFIVDLESAAIPCRGGLSLADRKRKEEREARFGPRRSGSRRAVSTVWRMHAPLIPCRRPIDDLPRRLRGTSGTVLNSHELEPSVTTEPAFPINHTLAMTRDGISRLVRRTWRHPLRV
jgi:hypothetical protein